MARFPWPADERALNYLTLIKDKRSCLEAQRQGAGNPVIKGGGDVSDVDKLDLIFDSSVVSRCHRIGSDGARTTSAGRLPPQSS